MDLHKWINHSHQFFLEDKPLQYPFCDYLQLTKASHTSFMLTSLMDQVSQVHRSEADTFIVQSYDVCSELEPLNLVRWTFHMLQFP